MKKEPLDLRHQSFLQPRFDALSLKISDYSFANLYLFRQLHRYEVLEIENEVFICGVTSTQTPFVLLTTPFSLSQFSLLSSFFKNPCFLYPLAFEWLLPFPEIKASAYFEDKESDYLFHKQKLIHYPGRYLSKKRNLVKQFNENYTLYQKELSLFNQPQALKLLDQWQQDQVLTPSETDYQACYEAIFLFSQLKLQGYLWFIEEEAVGLAIGELTKTNCFILHFFKGLKKFKGLHPVMYQKLAKTLAPPVEWINLEQDLGLPGLRQAKQSYLPDLLLVKWRVPFN